MRMDEYGDRYLRRNGKWVKIHKQTKGGYTVVRGWEGHVECKPFGKTINHRQLWAAKIHADSWLDDK